MNMPKCKHHLCNNALQYTVTATNKEVKYCSTGCRNAAYNWRHKHGVALLERALETNVDWDGFQQAVAQIRAEYRGGKVDA